MAQLIIKVAKGGKVSIEVNGATGSDCQKLTAGIEKALGKVDGRKLKPEFHAQGRVGQTQSQS